jgi:oxygen-independent coproporphyrinogen-3 oxidase
MIDIKINSQRLKRAPFTKLLRALVYRFLVGSESWPLRFAKPDASDIKKLKTSPNLYVHLPFCQSICPHCPYNKQLFSTGTAQDYRKSLIREVKGHLHRHPQQTYQSLYFGGGTPTLTLDIIADVISLVRPQLWELHEIGVEVHPAHATLPILLSLKEMGVTRISLGIETLRDELLIKLGRGYSKKQALCAIHNAKSVGFECTDVNLIFGIPGQSVQQSADDARVCTELGVEQISAYPLFTFIHTPLGIASENGKLDSYGEFARLKAQKNISRFCLDNGYSRTSVWSYTRSGIVPYSTVTHNDYIGFGAGAGSKVDGVFWFNTFSVDEYSRQDTFAPALILKTNQRFQKIHWVYWQIYKTKMDLEEYASRFGTDFTRDFSSLYCLLTGLGWAKKMHAKLVLTERGAVWAHKVQSLYSLSFIDQLWSACQSNPWPEEVVLS